MFEPQGTGFFLLLMMVFGGLLVWVAVSKQVVFRVLAACLAFIPAMVFGVAAVNKFYDYYQTWGGMINDLTGQGSSIPKYAAAGAGTNKQFDKNIGRVTNLAEDAQVGYLFQTSVTGVRSHLTRDVYVYLPPQYFQKAYAHYKFPVIELLHGSPGNPQAWVDVMGVIPTFLNLLENHPTDAAVLVMPDTDGGRQYGLQCLNNPGGIQDMTFVALDVPTAIARIARVQLPGRAWGLAGYSEGGYCTANIALQDPAGVRRRRRYVGVLRPEPEHGACGQQAEGQAAPGQRVPRPSRPAAHQFAAGIHHPGSSQRCAPRLLARGRCPGQTGCRRRGEFQAAAPDPGGERAVRDHSRWAPGQRVARGPRADAHLDDAATGPASRQGRRRRSPGGRQGRRRA